MKNTPIDPYAALGIQKRIDRILERLGNPEPPIDLREVRELLKLDLKYFSSTDTSALEEFVSNVKVSFKQVVLRPMLLVEAVLKANMRALWLPDRKRILINEDVHDAKKRHAEAHEITHAITPHHAPFLLGDDAETLGHSFHMELEAEANFGSGQLLFLRERFAAELRDLPLTTATMRALSGKFGNTLTMTLWRMVEEGHEGEPVFGIICQHPFPHLRKGKEAFDPVAPCKYFVESPAFREQFGNVTEVAAFEALQSYARPARGGPLGEEDVVFVDGNGDRHFFHMETFCNTWAALTIGSYKGRVPNQIVVPGM